jgi:hypothetical protein
MTQRRFIFGLDVSTSVTGTCLLDRDVEPDGTGNHIVLLDRIEFKKCVTLWDKADVVKEYVEHVKRYHDVTDVIVAIEEPLMGFTPGMSSATTITMLMRFNGIVSYLSRNAFGVDPQYISAAHARKLCGMKLQKVKVAGKSHKEQVFEYMHNNDLSHVIWPTKRSGQSVDWSRDATDAYVIARAACLVNK